MNFFIGKLKMNTMKEIAWTNEVVPEVKLNFGFFNVLKFHFTEKKYMNFFIGKLKKRHEKITILQTFFPLLR